MPSRAGCREPPADGCRPEGPLIRQSAFLADADFVLESDFDRLAGRLERQDRGYEV